MKLVPLSNGDFAKVEDDDFEWCAGYHWHRTSTGYAYRQERQADGRLKNIRMHRELTAAPSGMDVDHINGDRIDNQRGNLRLATRSDNLKNKTKRRSDNKSGVTGVFRHATEPKWTAQIHIAGKAKHLGLYAEFDDAVRARRAAELLHYGEFAPRTTSVASSG